MTIVRTSQLTGKVYSREIPCTLEEIQRWKTEHPLIQECFPNLSPEDREFILSGTTPEEWERMFE